MTDASERRLGPDRRERSRGGRRATDQAGYSPLVLVVDRDAHGRETCEAILAKPDQLKEVLFEGSKRARTVAVATMERVRDAMKIRSRCLRLRP